MLWRNSVAPVLIADNRASHSASIAADASTPCTLTPASISGASRRPLPHISSSDVPAACGRCARYHAISASLARGFSACAKRAWSWPAPVTLIFVRSSRGIGTRAAGEGPRETGIDGQCESAHEAEPCCSDCLRRSKDDAALRRSLLDPHACG